MIAHSEITGTRVLTAPEHIRGTQTRYTDPVLKQARAEWIASLPAETTYVELAAALGIAKTSAGQLMRRYGKPRPQNPQRDKPGLRGLRFGHVSGAILAGLTWEQQDALERRCAKTGETLAQGLVAICAEVLA